MGENFCRHFQSGNICTVLGEPCLFDNIPNEQRCNEMYHLVPDLDCMEKSFEEAADEIIEESGDF